MEDTTLNRMLVALAAGAVALFLAGAIRDAREEERERNAPPRWTDKNRWE
jgi:hypothetical protein